MFGRRKEVVRVLSIDWDYFIGCDALTRLFKFPDGGNENLNPFLQEIVWNNRYSDEYKSSNGERSLSHIKVLDPDFKQMCAKLRSSQWREVIVMDSHLYVYEVVERAFKSADKVEVWNVDFHHDMYRGLDNPEPLNCGNWVSKLHQKYRDAFIYHWVHRDDEESHNWFDLNKPVWYDRKDFGEMLEAQFDCIFICRSSVWSPPHLDAKFQWLVNQAAIHTSRCLMSDQLKEPRHWNEHLYDGLELPVLQQAKLTKEVIDHERNPNHLDG